MDRDNVIAHDFEGFNLFAGQQVYKGPNEELILTDDLEYWALHQVEGPFTLKVYGLEQV